MIKRHSMMDHIDETIRGFWLDLEQDASAVDLWWIYCDYLEEREHPLAETTRLWVAKRFSDADEHQHLQLQQNLNEGLRPLLPRRTNSIGTETVLVPRGSFWMSEHDKNAQRQVTVEDDFYMGVYQITQGEWEAIMNEIQCAFHPGGEYQGDVEKLSKEEIKRLPMETVSWNDAQEFLEILNERNENEGWEYHLPREIQWEHSCRGAMSSFEDCNFDFYFESPTNDLSSLKANFDGNSPYGNAAKGPYVYRSAAVGSYDPNVLGIYDMHGNMWEWCEDAYRGEEDSYAVRGGSWISDGVACRAGFATWYESTTTISYLGFRVAMVRK